MMGIGFPELVVILVIIMIIFGAGKLPEIGSAFGRSIKNFKTSMKEAEVEDSSSKEDSDMVASNTPPEEENVSTEAQAAAPTQKAQMKTQKSTTSGEQSKEKIDPAKTKKVAVKKEEEDIIDQAIKELKEELSETKINTIRTRHDGLVQERDVFTESVKKVPFGMKRTDKGISRDVF